MDQSESARALVRMKHVMELRAQGLTFAEIGAQVHSVRGDARPIGRNGARLAYVRGWRLLNHPSRATQLMEYQRTGTFTLWS